MEPSIRFHTLVRLVDAEEITIEKIRTVDSPLEINNVKSKLQSQNLSSKTYDPNPEIMCTHTIDPKNKSKAQL